MSDCLIIWREYLDQMVDLLESRMIRDHATTTAARYAKLVQEIDPVEFEQPETQKKVREAILFIKNVSIPMLTVPAVRALPSGMKLPQLTKKEKKRRRNREKRMRKRFRLRQANNCK